MKYPIVKLDNFSITDNLYYRGENKWDVTNLIQFCKEEKYKEFDLPVAGIDLSTGPSSKGCDWIGIIQHCSRIMDADLKYPVILDDTGYVCDGWHRIAKAILEGRETVKAVRMNKMPRPSGKCQEEAEND